MSVLRLAYTPLWISLSFISCLDTLLLLYLHIWSGNTPELNLGAQLDKRPPRISPRPSPTTLQDPSINPIMSDSRHISLLGGMKKTFWQKRRHLQEDEIKLQWAAEVGRHISILRELGASAQSLEPIPTVRQQMARQSSSESWTIGIPPFDTNSLQLDSNAPFSGYISPSISSPIFKARRTTTGRMPTNIPEEFHNNTVYEPKDCFNPIRHFSLSDVLPPTPVWGTDRESEAIEPGLDQKESDTNLPRSRGTVAARSDKLDHLSVEDGFSPIVLEQESALGIDLFEASKIRKLLLALFINDDVLRPIYKTALETMSPGSFERKFHVLLGSFAYDLQEEAHEVHEHNISSFCHSNRICIARYIRVLFTKESSTCDDTIRQLQLQLPDIRGNLVPILSARWSSQTHGKNSNIVHQLERFVTNSKALGTLRMGIKILAEPTTSYNTSAPNRQASAAVATEKRSPMLGEGTNVPSKASQNVETLDIRQAPEYRLLCVSSTDSQLLDPPLALKRSLLVRSYRYIISQVLGFLQGLNLYEPPLPANCVRLQWICVSLSPPQMANIN